VIAQNSSSLSVTWEPPEKDKRNGIIVNYTVCISHDHEESKPCFKEQTTKENMTVIDNLINSTKYYVRVLASTKVGPGNYSKSTGKFTNGGKFFSLLSEVLILLVFYSYLFMLHICMTQTYNKLGNMQ
jgi:hypothetical protein